MPLVAGLAAGCGHILNIDFLLLQICQGSDGTKGVHKDKHPSDNEEEEEEEEGEETQAIPKQGKASSVAEALADTQTELDAQSAIPSAKESDKESADSAKQQSDCAWNAVIKRQSEDAQRLKDKNADL